MKIYEYGNVGRTRRCGTKALVQTEHSVNVREMTDLSKSFKDSKEGKKVTPLASVENRRMDCRKEGFLSPKFPHFYKYAVDVWLRNRAGTFPEIIRSTKPKAARRVKSRRLLLLFRDRFFLLLVFGDVLCWEERNDYEGKIYENKIDKGIKKMA
ncbi:hypothetical protein NPIL_388601 [Nephila pilipes]|uniref:Uncharacterized protein n=1 Tax=Nephila pilipes TaxID=299642 RepID=A0A8X6QDJ6_NEPPI|nr:hypothetical protein NPIL_388601 [Nephila pilipes]